MVFMTIKAMFRITYRNFSRSQFIKGVSSVLEPIAVERAYVIPKVGDRQVDAQHLSSDWRRVGCDLRVVTQRELARYGR
jgi:hypothetical protein